MRLHACLLSVWVEKEGRMWGIDGEGVFVVDRMLGGEAFLLVCFGFLVGIFAFVCGEKRDVCS